MAPRTEADELRVLGKLLEKGYVFRGLKPVNWCFDCGSALAEAEVEYADKTDIAVDVGFPFLADELPRLAQAFGLAIDRLLTRQQAAERESHLQQAIQAHRHIGQAIGILVERHRLPPDAAFDRLRRASQDRNLKLRDLAARVIETGSEPENA